MSAELWEIKGNAGHVMNGVAKGMAMWSSNEDDYPQPREALIRANSNRSSCGACRETKNQLILRSL